MSDLRSAQIRTEQLRTYFRESSDQALAGSVVLALFAVLAARVLPLWTVLLAVFGVWLLAADLWRASRRADHADPRRYRFWERRQLVLGTLAGGCWGVISAAMILHAEPSHQFFALMLIAIVATVSAGDGAAMIRPTLGFIAGCVLPPLLVTAWVGDTLHWVLSGMLAVLLQINVVQALKRHRAFIHLLEARLDLEAMTRDLAAAKARAEAASEAKTAFLANISHELRTPMHAILGMTQLLAQDGAHSPAQRERLGHIRAAGDHLLGVIEQVLDVARADAHGLTLDERRFDPVEVIEQAVAMVRADAERKGLRLSFSHDLVSWRSAQGDAGRLRQAVLNYLANAVKFTDHGTVTITADGEPGDAGAWRLRVTVCDTGTGIPADVLPRLYQPFEQADASTTRRYGGTGLGLALTRQIVAAMGGEVGVDSTPGAGSRFWLTVRLLGHPDPVTVATATRAAGDPAQHLRQRHAGREVLVADDNPINRELMQRLLETAGLRVDTAADGVEAVKLAGARRYAAILMDMQMPRLDGLAAARALRQVPGLDRVPILAVSASVFEEDRQHCLAAGMNDLIGKPVLPDTLFATLLHHMPA